MPIAVGFLHKSCLYWGLIAVLTDTTLRRGQQQQQQQQDGSGCVLGPGAMATTAVSATHPGPPPPPPLHGEGGGVPGVGLLPGAAPPPREQLQHILSHLGINLTITPYSTSNHHHTPTTGVFCKNLLLKDRKHQFYLVILPHHKSIDLKKLKKDLGASRNFSFASPEELRELLGSEPGGVTPFGLIFDTGRKIQVAVDSDLNSDELLNFHPLNPQETTLVKYDQLTAFIHHLGFSISSLAI